MPINSLLSDLTVPLPNALTIAGSDSGGGAGIQADLKTFATLGVYGTSVITALTAQSGLGVTAIHAPDADFVAKQLETVLKDFPIHAAKSGMLFNAQIIEKVAKILVNKDFPYVLDPVCVSTSGHALIEEDAIICMKKELFPLADLITPNRPETKALTGIMPEDKASCLEAAKCFFDFGVKAVLIKGGHAPEKSEFMTDWYMEKGGQLTSLSQPFVDTQNTHGTGCTLSAAITANLARKSTMLMAIIKAQTYLNCALKYAYAPGKGIGPVHHLASLEALDHQEEY